ITLYELATGTIPKWGDGVSDPSYLECEITIDAELFDLALRDSLPEFFAKAFRRNICDRFDNAEEMLREWRSCFEGLEPAGATLSEEDVANLQEKIAIATGDTPIAELGLGARALQVLDRHNIFVVKDLLSVQKAWLISLRGVGSKTRREIGDIVEQLRDKEIAEAELNELRSQDVADPSKLSIDMLVQRITRASGKGAPKAKSRWVKDAAIVKLRGDVAEILADVGLVMSLDEAAAAILVARGSYYDEPQRTKNAIAILQIVLEVEAVMVKPRFRLYDSSENLRSPLIAASQEAFD
ncbi:MAG: DNA-directed RNA polymerase subunit alpha C-terminal domain-containing protein, partial [Pseudanabaena sp.]